MNRNERRRMEREAKKAAERMNNLNNIVEQFHYSAFTGEGFVELPRDTYSFIVDMMKDGTMRTYPRIMQQTAYLLSNDIEDRTKLCEAWERLKYGDVITVEVKPSEDVADTVDKTFFVQTMNKKLCFEQYNMFSHFEAGYIVADYVSEKVVA